MRCRLAQSLMGRGNRGHFRGNLNRLCVCFGFGFHVWRAPAAIASFFGRDIGHILIETFGKVVWICVFDARVKSRQISP